MGAVLAPARIALRTGRRDLAPCAWTPACPAPQRRRPSARQVAAGRHL